MTHSNTVTTTDNVQVPTVVPFYGANLLLVEHEGQPYTPMKPIVDGMGLDWSSQSRKLRDNDSRWGMVKLTIPSLDPHNAASCLPVRKLPGWMSSISPKKIKSEDVRNKVTQYQDECDDVLWSYWTKGIAINPRIPLTPEHQHGIQQAVARKVYSLPKAVQSRAWKKVYGELKRRFSVAKYDQIEDSRYTEALGAIQSFELEGEYLSGSMPAESLAINAPAAKRWSDYTVGELMGEDTMYGETNRMIRTLEKAAETGAPVYVTDMGAIEQEILALRHITETTMHRQHMLTSNLLSTNCHAEAVERTWVSTIGPAVSMFDRVLAANMREHIGVIRRMTGHALSRHSLPEAI